MFGDQHFHSTSRPLALLTLPCTQVLFQLRVQDGALRKSCSTYGAAATKAKERHRIGPGCRLSATTFASEIPSSSSLRWAWVLRTSRQSFPS